MAWRYGAWFQYSFAESKRMNKFLSNIIMIINETFLSETSQLESYFQYEVTSQSHLY
jgi:hypothetical protein